MIGTTNCLPAVKGFDIVEHHCRESGCQSLIGMRNSQCYRRCNSFQIILMTLTLFPGAENPEVLLDADVTKEAVVCNSLRAILRAKGRLGELDPKSWE
jgi:hypothetical protein